MLGSNLGSFTFIQDNHSANTTELEQLHQLGHNCTKWKKVANFTQFEEKKTHTSLCIIVHLCTIATVCTVTVALPFNILMLYSYDIKALISHFFLSPFTGQHQRLSLSLPVSFLSSSPHLLSSSASYQLLLIVITTGNYVIGLGFFQPSEEGGSTWRYLYQALGQFSLKKGMSFSH